MQHSFVPKLITVFQEGYSLKNLTDDLLSGLIVGIVALPLAIAFSIASGVEPAQGLYTAIIAGFTAALFGGSRVQVSGPTGAFIVVVYAIVQKHGYEGLALATFMAGIMMMFMGFFRMGALLRYIPYPVTVGFTSGIAVIIFSSQLNDFLGMSIKSVPAPFVDKWVAYFQHMDTVSPAALGVGLFSLALVIFFPKITRKVPSSLAALLLSTLVVWYFKIPVDTIGSRYGSVPHDIPSPQQLWFSFSELRELFPAAMTIAFLGAIESLLSAVVADGMLGTRHRSNMELVAQGLANVVSPIFLGIPATGAIARTAVNVRNGGRSPIAAMFHSVVLLLILVQFGTYAAYIPVATLAAILMFVAYNMSEYRTFFQILKAPREDVAVLLATFFLTVIIDLTVAIEVGVVLSAFLFMKNMENVSGIGRINEMSFEEEADDPNPLSKKRIPPGVEVFEMFGPLFYGVVERFNNSFMSRSKSPKVLILRMRNVPSIDASGLHALEDAIAKAKRDKVVLLLSSLKPQPLETVRNAGIIETLGKENVLPTVDAALRRASEIVGE